MQSTIEYIDELLITLESDYRKSVEAGDIDNAISIGATKIYIGRIRDVAEAEKTHNSKLEFERRIQSC